MQNNIVFFQTTDLVNESKSGLLDLLLIQLKSVTQKDVFTKIQIIVPNQAMASWLRDKIAIEFGICANIDCVVLAGVVIENIYKDNYPSIELLDFQQLKYIIYDYLLTHDLKNTADLQSYLYSVNGEIDLLRAFQLAEQLQDIFHEYLYLRTNELLNISNSKIKQWQQDIWQYILIRTNSIKNYLDIYKFFMTTDASKVLAPSNLFIFGLTSIYSSQLDILCSLSANTNIYWYYQPCSSEYYGDLLTSKARNNIEKKLLRQPYMSLDDLYLSDGNPLLANLGQQSREFIELLRANDIEVYDFTSSVKKDFQLSTMLNIIQHDIKELKNRIRQEYRLSNNLEYYIDPINIKFYKNCNDISETRQSLKINVCHNRMREVQVMFNEILTALDNNSNLGINEILVVSPDIDDYAPYISAVLDNEYAVNKTGDKVYLPYFITGARRHKQNYLLEALLAILESPYSLTVNVLLNLLELSAIKNALEIDHSDIKLIKRWLADNHTHFGYDEHDYAKFGYTNFSIYSFKQLLIQLTLGACISDELFKNKLAMIATQDSNYVPYDNLDYTQTIVANKLIGFINLLEDLRNNFYISDEKTHSLPLADILIQVNKIKCFLVVDEDDALLFDKFIGELDGAFMSSLDVLILIKIIHNYLGLMKNRLSLGGVINCLSLQYARNLPHKYIYVLGMNFGEFPASYHAKQLSILAQDWYIADRNYTIEDKQAFLEVILSASEQLVISYIGRKETDNSQVRSSPILGLLINVIGNSFSNFWINEGSLLTQDYNFQYLIEEHALHPFYNNKQINYAHIWHKFVNRSKYQALPRWNFARNISSPIKLTLDQKTKYLEINLSLLERCFLYTNNNLYRTLGINVFNNDEEFNDLDPIFIEDRKIASAIEKHFMKNGIAEYGDGETIKFLQTKGILGFGQIGNEQFEVYKNRYLNFIQHTNGEHKEFKFKYTILDAAGQEFEINFSDKLLIIENNIIIHEKFSKVDKILDEKFSGLAYELMVRSAILYLLLSLEAKFWNDNNIQNVIVRQISKDGVMRDVVVSHNDSDNAANRVLRYYLRSLTNPILIHKRAIESFINASNEQDRRTGTIKNTPVMVYSKTKNSYENSFNNSGLDTVRSDLLYSSIADDYFEYIEQVNGLNDIVEIGKLFVGVEYECK
ncbi:MAG: exodeoxyribonuclease V subunit gamma [Burkholderiales bacterium]|nr:exodeoxyribonuclease V subunit gamma [Burkholderiales bacterium]